MSAAAMKAKLEGFVRLQRQALTDLDASTTIERARLEQQIGAAQDVLDKWDRRVTVVELIDALTLAGIQVRTE
jgi:hypothetical protein